MNKNFLTKAKHERKIKTTELSHMQAMVQSTYPWQAYTQDMKKLVSAFYTKTRISRDINYRIMGLTLEVPINTKEKIEDDIFRLNDAKQYLCIILSQS